MSGAIAERVLEFVAHLAGCVVRQPLQTDGGPRDVTTQTFKTFTLLRPERLWAGCTLIVQFLQLPACASGAHSHAPLLAG